MLGTESCRCTNRHPSLTVMCTAGDTRRDTERYMRQITPSQPQTTLGNTHLAVSFSLLSKFALQPGSGGTHL